MKVTVIGLGYVGLPLAIRLSLLKYDVFAIDKNVKKIELLSRGLLPFAKDEPNLKTFFNKSKKLKNLVFTNSYEVVSSTELIFICVDTPTVNHKPAYESLLSAVKGISKFLKKNQTIILESTLAPKTTQNLIIPTIEKNTKLKLNRDFFVAVAPERIRPNYIFAQMTTLPRIVGVSTQKIAPKIKKVYSKITSGDIDITDLLTAEVAKTVENTYRDVQIAFANEIAIACEELGVNVWEIRRLVNKDPYKNIHSPGAGVGGHCIPKDPWLLASSIHKAKLTLTKSARHINDSMPKHIFNMITTVLEPKRIRPQKSKIAILGYSFVENSDDTRNSPTETLSKILSSKKIMFNIHDPHVSKYADQSVYEIVKGADVIVLMVVHDAYKKLQLPKLAKLMRTKIIIDGRNFFDKDTVNKVGFLYKGIGNV